MVLNIKQCYVFLKQVYMYLYIYVYVCVFVGAWDGKKRFSLHFYCFLPHTVFLYYVVYIFYHGCHFNYTADDFCTSILYDTYCIYKIYIKYFL
jgi:hypothetical protein